MRPTHILSLLLLALSSQAAVVDRLAGPLERTSSYRLSGHVRQFVKTARDAGAVDSDLAMGAMSIAIRPTDAQKADLLSFLSDVQDPKSSNYHKFLKQTEYAARFGASQNDLAKIAGWLGGQGLAVDEIARGGTWVRFHGTAANVAKAFSTEIRNYTFNGVTNYANASEPAVPKSLGPMVAAIRGLHSVHMKPAARKLPAPEFTTGSGTHYLSPEDIGTIYNVGALASQGIDGTGQTIAIVGATTITLDDTVAFRAKFNQPVGKLVLRSGPTAAGVDKDAQFEAAVDLQWAGAVAPGATLLYVSDASVEEAMEFIIDNGLAPVISSSYAEGNFGFSSYCDSADYVTDALFQQGMAQYANAVGITIINASGDTGAAGCDANGVAMARGGRSVTLPSAVPEVTAVGGTTFKEGAASYWNTTNSGNGGSAKSYIPETAWNDSFIEKQLSASGGGASVIFAKPAWQVGPGVPNDGARDVPDVSFSASSSHDPYMVCSGGCGVYVVGGTSVGAPIFAGMIALLNQYEISKGLQTAGGQGNVNPGLYQMAQTVPSAFHDITLGDNIVPCAAGSPDCVNGYLGFSAGVGYDQATGLGSVDAFNLISNWGANGGSVSTTTTVGAATGTVSLNSNLLLTATVKAASGTKSPTGTVTFRLGSNNSDGNYWQLLGTATLSGSGGTSTASFNFYPGQIGQAGTVAVTAMYSGDTTFQTSGKTVNVGISNAPAKNSAIYPYVNPSAVTALSPDSDGYKYFFDIGVQEFNGIASTLSDLKIDGVSYSAQLNALFGGTSIAGGGTIVAHIRWNPPTIPYTTIVEVSGRDAAGVAWTQQAPLVVTGRQLAANLVLSSVPSQIDGNAANTSCPWSQQLALYETQGRPVYLQNYYYTDRSGQSFDITTQIQSQFGTMRLAPFGFAVTQVCFTTNPGQIKFEVDALDDLGNPTSGIITTNYSGAVRSAATLSVTPATPSLAVARPGQTATAPLNIAINGAGQSWSISMYPTNRTTGWLTAYPSAGIGTATVTLTANSAGLLPGVYFAQLAISGESSTAYNTQPGVVIVPVVMTVGATGAATISGLQNAASYSQSYAPGMLMAVYGSGLAGSTASATSLPLPTNLVGVTATVNGNPAPLWFVSPGQVNLQIPYETGGGTAVVAINNNGNVSYQLFQVAPTAPGIFAVNGFLNPNATAKAGGPAFLYLTGDGDVTATLATGATPPTGTPVTNLPKGLATLTVTVGGLDAPVLFNGIVSGNVGVSQVNFQLPAGLTGVQPVVATVNGVASAPVNITITP